MSVIAKYRNAGQVCASPIRFLVHRSRYEAFRDAFVAGARSLRVGPGSDPSTQLGPVLGEHRVREMQAFVDDALAHGARLLCGGQRIDRSGFFYAATVLEQPAAKARVQREEPFGPIAVIQPYDTLDEAIDAANALPYGLGAYAFTRDLMTAHRLGEELAAGMVGINHYGVSQPELPFGGIKASGEGVEMGAEGILAYTVVKTVTVGRHG